MISKKEDLTALPIYLTCNEMKTVLNGRIKYEVKQSLKTYDIALRRIYNQFNEKGMIDNPLAKLTKGGCESVASLEYFTDCIYAEAEALKDYSERLKQQNEELRDKVYELKLENQQLKY